MERPGGRGGRGAVGGGALGAWVMFAGEGVGLEGTGVEVLVGAEGVGLEGTGLRVGGAERVGLEGMGLRVGGAERVGPEGTGLGGRALGVVEESHAQFTTTLWYAKALEPHGVVLRVSPTK